MGLLGWTDLQGAAGSDFPCAPSPLPTRYVGELAHDRRKVWGRGSGYLQVDEPRFALWVVLARRSLRQPVLALAMRADRAINSDDHTWKIIESPDHLAQREPM